jgi:Ca-activated chloride channel family protein
MNKVWHTWISVFLGLALAVVVTGCSDNSSTSGGSTTTSAASGPQFNIVAGSECKALQPIFDQFSQAHGVALNVTYAGSLDISQQLSGDAAADAYLPSNSLWITLGDTKKRVQYEKSIARTYVVFAVKKSKAEQLGWIGKKVTVSDILQAAQAGKIRYMMTSATQSNSGASAYFGYLYAFAGHPEMLSDADLNKPQLQSKIKAILGTVNRSAGSSGFLKDLFISKYDDFDGMVNYESVIIDTNKALVAAGKEPLYVIYPVDGLAIADYPLGYVDHGDAAKAQTFKDLQAYLGSAAVQSQIQALGWRTSPIGMQMANADPTLFNPDWGIDTKSVFSPIRFPDASTIRKALNLYQTTFRKPSFTVYCLDYSGSMGDNGGAQELKDGINQIFDQEKASRLLLQASEKDVTVVIPFNDHNLAEWRVNGNDPDKLSALSANVNSLQPDGGTNFYGALIRGLTILRSEPSINHYSPAIVLMTDGQDNQGHHDDYEQVLHASNSAGDVPIYSITYGDADTSQLSPIGDETSGKVFDGKTGISDALKEVKGYN